MKSILVPILVLFSFVSFSQDIGGYAIYKKKINVSKENIESNKNISYQLKQSLKSIDKVVDEFEYELVFNTKIARYSKTRELSIDNADQLSQKLANSIIGVHGEYYYDMVNLSSVNEVSDYGETILVLKSSKENKWVLTKESKTINDDLCYKATTKKTVNTRDGEITREIIAWYNPKITIPAGPDGYFGLPGLIFQVEENNIITYLIELKKQEKVPKINIPMKGKKMTEEEYNAYVNKVISNLRG
ncbi:GLPGLI family protein [uncultured Formosa sp.]|uniref:GLPGLI family protein n=1 Tax=uncultured Formosa sp. TaxID=255435 RepID=UPI00262368A1|nr:GLPGLI family protein [uncultured Formosa sp.]